MAPRRHSLDEDASALVLDASIGVAGSEMRPVAGEMSLAGEAGSRRA